MSQVQTPTSPLLGFLRNLSDEELRKELREVENAMTALETTAALIKAVMAWKTTMNGSDTRPAEGAANIEGIEGKRPTLRAALLILMSEQQRAWRIRELLEELERRDWGPRGQNRRSQLEARLSKMKARGEVVRVAPGTYAVAAGQEELREAPSQGDGKA